MNVCCALLAISFVLMLGAGSSPEAPEADVAEIRREIEAQIARGVAATRDEDIEAYMEGLPEDLVIYDERGEVISREQQRAYALRDWAVISRTLDIEVVLDSLAVAAGSLATVYTSQRWERLMLRPDGSGEDTVLTTQRHRETWRPTPRGWRLYEVDELGGRVWINGEPYHPD